MSQKRVMKVIECQTPYEIGLQRRLPGQPLRSIEVNFGILTADKSRSGAVIGNRQKYLPGWRPSTPSWWK